MRGAVTGNSDIIFDRHYDLTRASKYLDTLMETFRHHRGENVSDGVTWTPQMEKRRQKDKEAIEAANLAVLLREEVVDLTSKSKPMTSRIRIEFGKQLEKLAPGLWNSAGRTNSEMKWIWKVIIALQHPDATALHELVFQHYQGKDNIMMRRWSGAHTHEAQLENGISTRNCPLTAAIRVRYLLYTLVVYTNILIFYRLSTAVLKHT